VAASGGYQISAVADEIWAQETTVTGSIGVVLQFPTLDRALDELGIHNDGVGTTELAGGLNLARPLLPAVERRFELTTEQAYRQFLDLVAEGRGMNVEQVRRAAEGQVWTGRQALDLGLVDRLGQQRDAVASAAGLAGLDDYELVVLEKPLSFEERLLASLPLSQALSGLLPDHWSRALDRLAAVSGDWQLDPGVVYSLCEDCRALP
jgi:protease-4